MDFSGNASLDKEFANIALSLSNDSFDYIPSDFRHIIGWNNFVAAR